MLALLKAKPFQIGVAFTLATEAVAYGIYRGIKWGQNRSESKTSTETTTEEKTASKKSA